MISNESQGCRAAGHDQAALADAAKDGLNGELNHGQKNNTESVPGNSRDGLGGGPRDREGFRRHHQAVKTEAGHEDRPGRAGQPAP